MKYSNLKAFEKHLESSAPNHMSPVYLVMSKEDFERKTACGRIADLVLKGAVKPGQNYCAFDAEQADYQEILQELQSFSFFAPKKIVVIHHAEKLSKNEQENLRSYFLKPNSSVCLVVDTAGVNRATNFYKDAEKIGVVFDAAEEKPWEKEKSMQAWVVEQLAGEGKHIDSSTASLLVRQLGTDQATLHQELEKLICFVGAKKEISSADVSAVCTTVSQENAWQLGEAIFKRDAAEAMRITKTLLEEGTVLIALLRQIRTQFQTDYQVCCMLADGKTAQDISQKFPFMRGNILNKHMQQAQAYGIHRFKSGLLAIDETELMAKNSAGDPDWLAERLIFKLATK